MAGFDTLFSLTHNDEDLHVAPPVFEGGARVYGAHMMCQALVAAGRTVEGKNCHVLSGRFLRPGDTRKPLHYMVRRVMDGRNFAVRQIDVMQEGRQIMMLSASFQTPAKGLEFQYRSIPTAPPPELFQPEFERTSPILSRYASDGIDVQTLPDEIDARWLDPQDHERPVVKPGDRQVWVRLTGILPPTDEARNVGLAYFSDYALIETFLRPHARSWTQPSTQAASLDHTIWFHSPSDPEQWHLYLTQAVRTVGQRAFVRGEIFSRDGTLVASVAQEGLLRTN